jgi:hypothetical protein
MSWGGQGNRGGGTNSGTTRPGTEWVDQFVEDPASKRQDENTKVDCRTRAQKQKATPQCQLMQAEKQKVFAEVTEAMGIAE